MPDAITVNQPFTPDDVKDALSTYGGEQGKTLLQEPKMFKATFDLLRAVATSSGIGAASALTSASSVSAKYMGASSSTVTGVKSASFALSTFKASMDMVKVTQLASTGAVLGFVGALTVQKTGLAISFAGGDSEKAKCYGAIMELAGSAVATILTAPTGVLAVLAAASLSASVFNTHQSCMGQYPWKAGI